MKDNIEAINNGIDIVNKINPVSFNWKSSGKKAYGVIAQEIEEVIPEIVSKNSKGIFYFDLNDKFIESLKKGQSLAIRFDSYIRGYPLEDIYQIYYLKSLKISHIKTH